MDMPVRLQLNLLQMEARLRRMTPQEREAYRDQIGSPLDVVLDSLMVRRHRATYEDRFRRTVAGEKDLDGMLHFLTWVREHSATD